MDDLRLAKARPWNATFHNLDDIPADFGPTAGQSVGNFDGVHRAHRHVMDEIVRRAKAEEAQVGRCDL